MTPISFDSQFEQKHLKTTLVFNSVLVAYIYLIIHHNPEEMICDLLCQLNTYKSMGPEGMHLKVRERAKELVKPLSIIYKQSWLTRELPGDWKLGDVISAYKKGWKDDPSNYRSVIITSLMGKVTEQMILSVITCHVQDNQRIRPRQHRFTKGRSCLTNLVSFHEKVTQFVDEGKSVNPVYIDFSKAFGTVSHSFLLEQQAAHGWDGCTLTVQKPGWMAEPRE